jgi:hypothetical protein
LNTQAPAQTELLGTHKRMCNTRREIIEEGNPISLAFQNIDPPSPSPPASVWCTPRLCCGGRTDSPGGEGDGAGGSIVWKAREIGLPSYNDLSTVTPRQGRPIIGLCSVYINPLWRGLCTDKKSNQIFLIYKAIQNGAVAKSYATNGLLIYGEIFAHFLIS